MNLKMIELLGEQHPLCFSMTVAQNLTRHFGSMEQFGEQLMHEDATIRRDAVCDALTELLKAGRIYAKAMGEPLPKEIPCQVSDILRPETAPLVALIVSVMQSGAKREVETEDSGKNAVATLGP